jgi:lysyl-tRNA synthetase class 2
LALDENIYQLRLEKLKQIEALGQHSYPTKYEFTYTIPEILAEYSSQAAEQLEAAHVNVRVAGRIMAIRLMGKAGFAHLQQNGGRLQIYVKKDAVGEKAFDLYRLLDLGDHVGVSGYLFRTRTGELSVHVEEITFLSKDLLPLPEKWHGLTDVELRYRQRYVDLFMNPGNNAQSFSASSRGEKSTQCLLRSSSSVNPSIEQKAGFTKSGCPSKFSTTIPIGLVLNAS